MALSRSVRAIRCALWTILAASATACWGKAEMSVQYAPGFQPAQHKISIFGVYKDGRMNSEAWGGIAPGVSKALGGRLCDAAYGTAAFPADRDVTRAIDEYATSNGPTDDLLGQIAPAAAGDLVMVLTVAGHLPVPVKVSVQDQPQRQGPGGAYGGRGRHRGKDFDLNELQLAAQVFSVSEGKTVAVVNLDYTGQSVDEAWTKFTAQIGESLPGSECTGWRADAKLDADKIRSLAE
jgi:hypothetical protein